MPPDSSEPVPALALQGVDDIDLSPDRKMRRSRRLVERDRLRRRRAVTQLQAQVTAIGAEGLDPYHLDLAAEQQRLPIPDAEWRQHLNLLVKAWLEIRERCRCLNLAPAGEGAAIEACRRVLLEAA